MRIKIRTTKKTKKTKKTKQIHQIKQISKTIKNGGGKNMKFHYTKDQIRGDSIESLYPFATELIHKLHTIPWKSYKFDGKTDISTDDVNIDNNTISVSGTAILPSIPYYIGGGAAFELWNVYDSKVDLHKYVDPTADIDIVLSPPIFKQDENIDYDFSRVFILYIF